MADSPLKARAANFFERLSLRRDNSKSSDFTIHCRGRDWQVHKIVLESHSKVMEKWWTSGFQEAIDSAVDLSDDHEPAVVEALVDYLYSCDYSTPESQYDGEYAMPMAFHVQMCVVANKYLVDDLEHLAVNKFLTADTNSVDPDDMAEAAILAWEAPEPTRAIQDIIVDYAVKKDSLFDGSGTDSAFDKVLTKIPGLARRIAKEERRLRLQSTHGAALDAGVLLRPEERRFKCPDRTCGQTFVAHIPQTMARFMCIWCRVEAPGTAWQHHIVIDG